MSWIALHGVDKALVSDIGAEAFETLKTGVEEAASDGEIERAELEAVLKAAQSSAVGRLLNAAGGVRALTWLTRSPLELAAHDAEPLRFDLPDLNTGDVAGADWVGLEFSADAALALDAEAAGRTAPGALTISLDGEAAFKGELGGLSLPDWIKTLAITAEASAKRGVEWRFETPAEARLAERLPAIARTMAVSPFSEAGFKQAFGPESGLQSLSFTGARKGSVDAKLDLQAPFTPNRVIAVGQVELQYRLELERGAGFTLSFERDAEASDRVRFSLDFKRDHSRTSTLGLGATVRFRRPDVMKLVAERLLVGQAAVEGAADRLAELGDLSSVFKTKLKERLGEAAGGLATTAMFERDKFAERLAEQLGGRLETLAKPWEAAAKDTIKRAGAGLLSELDLGDHGEKAAAALNEAVDDAFKTLDERFDEKLSALAEAVSKDELGPLLHALSRAGAGIDSAAATAEAIKEELKGALSALAERAGALAAKLEDSATYTVALNYTRTRATSLSETTALEGGLDLSKPGALAAARALIAAPYAAPVAMMEALRTHGAPPEGVTLDEASYAKRTSDAVTRAFSGSLFGIEFGQSRKVTFQTEMLQVGSVVAYAARSAVRDSINDWSKNEGHLAMATVFSRSEALERKFLEALRGESAEKATLNAASLLSLMVSIDDRRLLRGEVFHLLEQFVQVGVLSPLRRERIEAELASVAFGKSARIDAALAITREQVLDAPSNDVVLRQAYDDAFADAGSAIDVAGPFTHRRGRSGGDGGRADEYIGIAEGIKRDFGETQSSFQDELDELYSDIKKTDRQCVARCGERP